MAPERIDPHALVALCAPLRRILDAELGIGNRVTDADVGRFTKDGVFVLLEKPFLALPQVDPSITRVEINDPQWWKTELRHAGSGHVLACRFG